LKITDINSTMRVLLIFLAAAAAARPQSTNDAGKKAYQQVCFDCHGADMIEGMGQSKADWQETVDQMVAKGARGTEDQLAAIVEYLSETFPPKKINVNTESASDLQLDLDISGKAAAAIVHYRESHGNIKTLAELEKVPDVEPAKIEAKKDRLVF